METQIPTTFSLNTDQKRELTRRDHLAISILCEAFEIPLNITVLGDMPLILSSDSSDGFRTLLRHTKDEALQHLFNHFIHAHLPLNVSEEGNFMVGVEGITIEGIHMVFVHATWNELDRLYILKAIQVDEPGSDMFLDIISDLQKSALKVRQALKELDNKSEK